jgi:hypothetical protein
MKFESPAGDNAPRRPFADSWPLTGARHTLAARRNGLSQVPPFMVLPGTRYTRIECGPKMSGMPFEQACEMIISATSCDHKRALDGFILSPQKLIATTGLAPTTVRRKEPKTLCQLGRDGPVSRMAIATRRRRRETHFPVHLFCAQLFCAKSRFHNYLSPVTLLRRAAAFRVSSHVCEAVNSR